MNHRRLSRISWRKVFLVLTALFSGLGFICGGILWFAGGELIEPSNHTVGPPPSGYEIESVKISSDSGSGHNLAGWYMHCAGAEATVVLLHPNRSDRRSMMNRAKLLHANGFSTLLVDLQGHGESPGEHITAGFLESRDVRAAVDYVRNRNPEHRIGIIGRSLGGAAAILASPIHVDVLILESVYPTIQEAIHNRVAMRLGGLSRIITPILVAQLKPRLGISPARLRPVDSIGAMGCPVVIASGDRDEHTTLAETQRLFDAAAEPKRLVIFVGAAHEDLLSFDPLKYNEIIQFMNTHLTGTQ